MGADTGFHITITYRRELDKNEELAERLDDFLDTYFPKQSDKWEGRFITFPDASVGKQSTIMLHGDREFGRELRWLVDNGSGKSGGPHISLD